MNYCAEIAGLMGEADKLYAAADAREQASGRDPEYRLLRIQAKQMAARKNELRRQAAQEFAALNGWRLTERGFSPETLARGGTHSGLDWGYDLDLLDHPVFFREIVRPYRTAAIVGQPYDTKSDEARAIAAKIGLALHVPPKATASWWYPGWARFFCFTRREIASVQFLPEQLGEKRSET
jgi:hypothetical protein